MSITSRSATPSDYTCPWRDGGAGLDQVTLRIYDAERQYYECPRGNHHVTQQWEPPRA